MAIHKLGRIEMRFAEIIWANEPVASGTLVKLCEEELSWKKSTMYTVLRKLCDNGLFQNEGGLVTSLISREEFLSMQSEEFVEDSFHGSLPKFLAAFTARKKLSEKEIQEIYRIIDEHSTGED